MIHFTIQETMTKLKKLWTLNGFLMMLYVKRLKQKLKNLNYLKEFIHKFQKLKISHKYNNIYGTFQIKQ